MDFAAFVEYCLQKPLTVESFPFDDRTLVFKVAGKMFALADVHVFESVNLKCDPERAIELREQFQGIQPGFHMNKKHWNTVLINRDVSDAMVYELIDHSYSLVYASLPKKLRNDHQVG
jgi:predicted DNA-binding protein (MmcQ/YjbR family)